MVAITSQQPAPSLWHSYFLSTGVDASDSTYWTLRARRSLGPHDTAKLNSYRPQHSPAGEGAVQVAWLLEPYGKQFPVPPSGIFAQEDCRATFLTPTWWAENIADNGDNPSWEQFVGSRLRVMGLSAGIVLGLIRPPPASASRTAGAGQSSSSQAGTQLQPNGSCSNSSSSDDVVGGVKGNAATAARWLARASRLPPPILPTARAAAMLMQQQQEAAVAASAAAVGPSCCMHEAPCDAVALEQQQTQRPSPVI